MNVKATPYVSIISDDRKTVLAPGTWYDAELIYQPSGNISLTVEGITCHYADALALLRSWIVTRADTPKS